MEIKLEEIRNITRLRGKYLKLNFFAEPSLTLKMPMAAGLRSKVITVSGSLVEATRNRRSSTARRQRRGWFSRHFDPDDGELLVSLVAIGRNVPGATLN